MNLQQNSWISLVYVVPNINNLRLIGSTTLHGEEKQP